MSAKAAIRKVIRRAEAQGFRHVILGNSHHRFYAPDGVGIVQCSSTQRDGGWFHKFLCEMRKAGYKERDDMDVKQSVKETVNGHVKPDTAMAAAFSAAAAAEPVKRARGTLTEAVRDILRSRDRSMSIGEIAQMVRARNGFSEITETQIGILLARLVTQGEIRRSSAGIYAWPMRPAEEESGKLRAPLVHATPPLQTMPGDEHDPDETELDEALAALGRIEGVVRKWKTKIRAWEAEKARIRALLE